MGIEGFEKRAAYPRPMRIDVDEAARAEVAARPDLIAELAPEPPRWHVVACTPSEERIAAAHMIARGFGVYLPMWREIYVSRGRKLDRERLIFPGYLLLFAWRLDQQCGKVTSAPGVAHILMVGDRLAVIPDALVDRIRAEENRLNPLPMIRDAEARKRPRRGWKRTKREGGNEMDVIAVRSWSAMQDSNPLGLDESARRSLLLDALEVPARR